MRDKRESICNNKLIHKELINIKIGDLSSYFFSFD